MRQDCCTPFLALVVLLSAGCSETTPMPDGSLVDSGVMDAGPTNTMDGAASDGAVSDGAVSDGSVEASVPDASVVDCSPIAERADWELCDSTATSCTAVFTDGAGCAAVCAEAGLDCATSFENLDDACGADTGLPELGCAATGHDSDYCVCDAAAAPGCGNGTCDGTETCATCEEDCDVCPSGDYRDLVDGAIGFARPTGGREGPRIFVTSLGASGSGTLADALAMSGPKWISFASGLEGSITPSGRLTVPRDTTIDGRGADITLTRGLRLTGTEANNVIIHNLHFDVTGDDDAIQIAGGADNIWIDHCTFDGWGDGAIDVTNGIAGVNTDVTVSWTRIEGGSLAMLISATSDPGFGHVDENLYVTHHHNYYRQLQERVPRVRFAKVHTFNNVNEDWEGYSVGASTLAEVLVENNIFDADSDSTACRAGCIGADCDFHGGAGGAVRESGNVFDGGAIVAMCETSASGTVFDEFTDSVPPYAYTLDTADTALRSRVVSEAGWRDAPLPD